jgi:hypothetical protein
MPFGTIWFTWYLAIAGRFDAHNNEVGGAARVTDFRQFIRFHVHPKGLTGYVIAIRTEDTVKDAAEHGLTSTLDTLALTFHLIDVFTIETPDPHQVIMKPNPIDPTQIDLMPSRSRLRG